MDISNCVPRSSTDLEDLGSQPKRSTKSPRFGCCCCCGGGGGGGGGSFVVPVLVVFTTLAAWSLDAMLVGDTST